MIASLLSPSPYHANYAAPSVHLYLESHGGIGQVIDAAEMQKVLELLCFPE
jgi:hypothetical protein